MTITDNYQSVPLPDTGPIIGGLDITPNDSADLTVMTRALMVTADGDVAVVLRDGTAITLPGLTAGTIYPVRVSRVKSTGTTATGIKGLY